MESHRHKVAFEMLDKALARGFPIRPKDVLQAWSPKDVGPIMRAYARSGKADYTTHGSVDWLVPLNPKIDVDGFSFMIDPRNIAGLRYAVEKRIYSQEAMIVCLSDAGMSEAESKKVFVRLWHLDYVRQTGTTDSGDILVAVTGKGRLLYKASLEYFAPRFARMSDASDMSRFHSVVDAEVIRDP